jgi:hypothetical protein
MDSGWQSYGRDTHCERSKHMNKVQQFQSKFSTLQWCCSPYIVILHPPIRSQQFLGDSAFRFLLSHWHCYWLATLHTLIRSHRCSPLSEITRVALCSLIDQAVTKLVSTRGFEHMISTYCRRSCVRLYALSLTSLLSKTYCSRSHERVLYQEW